MKKESIFVIGHKNPDTDSICSAIALAEFKRATGLDNVFAARAGDLNPQTSFILDYFGAEPPRYLPDVYPKAKDVMTTDVVKVLEHSPLIKVMEIMRDERIRFVPVVDKKGRPVGVLSLLDLAKRYVVTGRGREVTTALPNIAEALGARVVLDFLSDDETTFSVYVGAMAADSFEWILGGMDTGSCAVVVGDRVDIQMTSVEKGVGLLIVSGGFQVEGPVVEAARKKRTSIIVSPHDSATTAMLVRLSSPAGRLSEAGFEKAAPDELVDELKGRLASTDGLIVLDDEGVMKGVVTKSSLLKPSGISLILVDHNELSQAVDGADRVSIIEVIDHHRIGNFHSLTPIPFICEPVGSTSTLVSEMFRDRNVPVKKETAGLLLGGVLSDTVILKSPTTTGRDRKIAKWLEEKAGLDHMAFGSEIFGATSSLKKRGAEAAVTGDYKVFESKGRKFGIGQVEVIGFTEFFDEKGALKEELRRIKEKKDLKLSALLVTDIVYGTSLLLAVGEKEVMGKLDYPKIDEGVFELRNVISRKKQVVPHILSLFSAVY